jgi:hypothetical protein
MFSPSSSFRGRSSHESCGPPCLLHRAWPAHRPTRRRGDTDPVPVAGDALRGRARPEQHWSDVGRGPPPQGLVGVNHLSRALRYDFKNLEALGHHSPKIAVWLVSVCELLSIGRPKETSGIHRRYDAATRRLCLPMRALRVGRRPQPRFGITVFVLPGSRAKVNRSAQR